MNHHHSSMLVNLAENDVICVVQRSSLSSTQTILICKGVGAVAAMPFHLCWIKIVTYILYQSFLVMVKQASAVWRGSGIRMVALADACMFPSFCYHCEVLILFYCTCQSWGMCLPASDDSKHVPTDSGQNLVKYPVLATLLALIWHNHRTMTADEILGGLSSYQFVGWSPMLTLPLMYAAPVLLKTDRVA